MKSHFLISLLLVFVARSEMSAVTKTSTQSGNWSSSSTWGGNPIPGAGDDVIISGGFSVAVDIPNATSLSVQLGGSVLGAGTGTLTFAGGSQLTVLGPVSIGPFNNNNTAGSLSMAGGGTLQCEGLIVGRLGTWTAGTGTIAFTATNNVPSDNNVDFNNLTVTGGTTTLTRNVTIAGDLVIGTGATLNGGANTLTFSGNWTNNGTFNGNTGTVTFSRNGNQTIAGTGTNNFNLVRVNMGTGISNTLEVVSSHFNAPDAFLTITNGTFKMSGTFSFANSFFVGPIYNIQPTSGFWLNNPNVTVTAQAGGISVRGLLRLSAGTYNIGTAVDHSLDYVAGSTIIIEGGTLTIAGRLTRNNATATTAYTQSGGTLTVVAQGSTDPAFGGFDLGAVGSSFAMSGGSLIVRNATSAPADFVNASSLATVTGGTLQIGDASTANAQVIRIQSARPIGNLLVSNATAQGTKPTAQLLSSLNVVGDVTLQPGTTLAANGLNVSVGGNWVDNGTFTTGGNSVTFNGPGAQSITRTGGETFNNLIVNKTGGVLTLNGPVTVGNSFSLSAGTVAVANSTLTLDATVSGGGVLTSAPSGTVAYNQSGDGQAVLAGTYGNLTFSSFNKVLPASGSIGIAGLFTAGTASAHTVTGSSFDFNGGAQVIPPFNYNNLSLTGSGIKTGSGTLTVTGNLTNNAGVAFTGATVLNLNGSTHVNNGTLGSGTLAVGSGATLTNGGIVTAGTALNGAGALVQGNGATLNIGGAVGIATLNATAAGNTVNYSGVAQTIAPVTYQNLTLTGTGSPTLTSVSTINGNFTVSGGVTALAATAMAIGGNLVIGAGTTFNAGSFSHALAGSLLNSGSFVGGTGSLALNGVSLQNVGNVTFNNVVVNNAAGVALSGDVTIGGALSLVGGTFSIGNHTLTLNGSLSIGSGTLVGGSSSGLVVGGSGTGVSLPALSLNTLSLSRAAIDSLGGDLSISGALSLTNGTLITGTHSVLLGPGGSLTETAGHTVVGNVQTTRTVAATGTETFGNMGIDLLLNGTAPGLTTVTRKTGTASTGNGHNSIKRYFDITPATNTGLNAGLVYHFDTSELNGQDVNTLELYRSRDNGSTWSNLIGTVNPVAGTLTVAGINDLSRWTAADTTDRIGNTATPVLSSIVPTSKSAGDPAFTLTVHGTDFLNGKSSVRFNGSIRTTTFVNSTQLTASIPASDLLAVGTFPVTVFNAGGGGFSGAQTFTVTPGAPTVVRVETAADGSGTIVPAQALVSGSSITVYAISRDNLNNFVANVPATSWTLGNVTGGVSTGDLVPSSDAKSAVFTGHVTGSADVRAISGVLPSAASGILTVTAGSAAMVRVETVANGSGTILPAQSLSSGLAITGYAITRDASNNFVANVAATSWSLDNVTGGIVPIDLVPSVDGKSAVFTGHLTGTANIRAIAGVLVATPSGMLTVVPGAASGVRVETASDGSGTIVPAQSVNSGSALTMYAISRDALNNFVANIPADQWSVQNITGGVVQTDLVPSGDGKSAVFTGHAGGSGSVRALAGSLGSFASGLITVIPPTITSNVSIAAGWNLISNPVTNPVAGDSVRQLYPGAISAYAFEYSGGYQQVFRLANGKGYWERFPAAAVNPILGLPRTRDSISVAAGWNIVGTISDTVDTNAITSIPPGLKASRWFGYAGGYSAATQLIPGKGYWVKSAAAGKFVFGNPLADHSTTVATRSETALSELNTLTVIDNNGGSQTLYFGAGAGDAVSTAMDAMPPLPPAGAFDARISTADGGTMVQTFDAGSRTPVEIPVVIQAEAYPVTFRWTIRNAATGYLLTDGAGGSKFLPKQMTGENEMRIMNSDLAKVVIRVAGGAVAPREFALDQNYPNPFNPSTRITYELPVDSRVTLKVYDALGRDVTTLANGEEKAGSQLVEWNASGLASGVYFCRIQAGSFVATRRMLLLK